MLMKKKWNKKIVATIEARMRSSRLPGKVLLPLAGKPALERLIERLQRSQYVDTIIVATTTHESDLSIVELTKKLDIPCYQGSELDVLGRVLAAAQSVEGEIIVEITGDCPVADHRVVDRVIEEFFTQGVDYASNMLTPGYANGFNVQVFPTALLAAVDQLTQDPIDRVHVSYYIYRHPEKYQLHQVVVDEACYSPDLRVTIDERLDYELLSHIYDRLWLCNPDFSAADVVRLLRQYPALAQLNQQVRQKAPEEG